MKFIEIDMFLSLAGCIFIVAMMVQALKQFIKINPHILNITCSALIGIIRIFVVNDLSWTGILTGILNVFVIYLAATGGYETVKQATKKEELIEYEDAGVLEDE